MAKQKFIKKLKKSLKSEGGFTLLELLLYIAILTVFVGSFAMGLAVLLQTRVKNETIAEVEQQGEFVMAMMTQQIRNSEAINSPAQGASASSLSLDVVEVADDPTLFDLSTGYLRVTEGVGAPVLLTNSRVVVTDMSFENVSRDDTPGTVKIQFTISHINPEGRSEYSFTKTFYGSASLRK